MTYDIINIDTGDLVETLESLEDAREFVRIHPDAENLAILETDGENATFVD